MDLISKADVVLAVGTRLNPFSTLPGYGIVYWPRQAQLIQAGINANRIGLTRPVNDKGKVLFLLLVSLLLCFAG